MYPIPVFDEDDLDDETDQCYRVFLVTRHELGATRCRKCGDWFKLIAQHVEEAHDLSFVEYERGVQA